MHSALQESIVAHRLLQPIQFGTIADKQQTKVATALQELRSDAECKRIVLDSYHAADASDQNRTRRDAEFRSNGSPHFHAGRKPRSIDTIVKDAYTRA